MTKFQVKVIEIIDLPVEKAWPAFSDFANPRLFMPEESFSIDGVGVGAVRTLGTPNGVVKERLVSFDDEARTYSYVIVNDDAPLPITNYLATVRLRADSDGRCQVEFSCEFEPRGAPGEATVSTFENMYRGFIRKLTDKISS